MAIIPYTAATPEEFALAYNDNVYVWRSTDTSPTLRFKVNIMPSGTLTTLATLIVYPIPEPFGTSQNRAFVDVSRVLQSQLSKDLEIPTANNAAFFMCPNMHTEYRVVVQEQDISATTGAYTDLNQIYFYEDRSVWNGVQNTADWLDFDHTDYLMTVGVGTDKFLTEGPNAREINSDQSAFLYFIAGEDQAPARYRLRTYDGYNGTGSVLNNVTVANPFAAAMTASYQKKYLRIPVGTYDIPLIDSASMTGGTPSTVLNNAKSYTIRLEGNVGVGQVISETFTFNVDQNCTKFTPVRLHWMNRLGGFDSFNFDLKSEERTDVNRRDFRQQHHTWDGPSYASVTWAYNKENRGRKTYDTQLTKKLRVNTNYLTDAESVWMEDLFTSPEIYQEVNNELLAVNIDGRSIAKKTSLNDKLCQYSFDLEHSLQNSRQRG